MRKGKEYNPKPLGGHTRAGWLMLSSRTTGSLILPIAAPGAPGPGSDRGGNLGRRHLL